TLNRSASRTAASFARARIRSRHAAATSNTNAVAMSSISVGSMFWNPLNGTCTRSTCQIIAADTTLAAITAASAVRGNRNGRLVAWVTGHAARRRSSRGRLDAGQRADRSVEDLSDFAAERLGGER